MQLRGMVVAMCATGCNALAVLQGGPTVASEGPAGGPIVPRGGTTYVGGQVEITGYVDFAAPDEYLRGQRPPETATRTGVTNAVYVRGTGQGFGLGERPGLFTGVTNDKAALLVSVGVPLGLQTANGTAYFDFGISSSILAGVVVHKEFAERSIFLCRELTYVTTTVQGNVDKLPAAGLIVPSLSLLVGVMFLDDGGAASDEKKSDGRCPKY